MQSKIRSHFANNIEQNASKMDFRSRKVLGFAWGEVKAQASLRRNLGPE